MNARGILIVGGYGIVGRLIAAELAPQYPDQVIVAGRNCRRALETAAEIGFGARGREIDVMVPSSIAAALSDVSAVMSCIDQPGRHLLLAAIEYGLRYTDITPHLTELGSGAAYEKVRDRARDCGACLVLGAGIVPGISNVMAGSLAQNLGGAQVIETSLLLSARDVTGPASFDYFLQELSMIFDLHVDGANRPVRAFSNPQRVEFPPPVGMRTAYLFPFSDQVLYPRTLGARTVLTRLAIEPPILAELLATLIWLGAATLFLKPFLRNTISRLRSKNLPRADTRFALRVDVSHHGRSSHAMLIGHTQAAAAAAGAIGIFRPLLDGEVTEPGAWMPEQVIDAEQFLRRLASAGLHVEIANQMTTQMADGSAQ
jgi:saccharopine dehydrogenase (NAD+, L-lysine forming)